MPVKIHHTIFYKIGLWLWPERHLVNHSSFKPNQQVLLYGNVSIKLVKLVLKSIGKNGKVLVIGRNSQLTRYRKLMHSNYQQQVIINPFFENLTEGSLDTILVFHAKFKPDELLTLAHQTAQKLKHNGRLLIIANKNSTKTYIELYKQQANFQRTNSSFLLAFQKIH
ncbi:MAG: hypothetical protein CVU09_11540 [Bacteroidetes bacterium HGW-Bacteroidetes-4]|jgi:hypothetical protein|nr:MAG: hypothetical protein CVU09_11540 [Bacteroidetes bacterium HGW-Bacteroidetes-4]